MTSIGIIGAGSIGQALHAYLDRLGEPRLSIAGWATRSPEKAPAGARVFADVDALLDAGVDVVVEAAGHAAVAEHAARVLRRGVDLVCLSVGALADPVLHEEVVAAAAAGPARLLVPSGAVGGLDALQAAAATAGLQEVEIEQRKPPAALFPAEDAAKVTEPTVVYEGSARAAVQKYPKTTNIAAAVALAGVGFDATRVRVVADPALRANRATLVATGEFGRLTLEIENTASANPRTSVIVAQSVVATLLRRYASAIVIPA